VSKNQIHIGHTMLLHWITLSGGELRKATKES